MATCLNQHLTLLHDTWSNRGWKGRRDLMCQCQVPSWSTYFLWEFSLPCQHLCSLMLLRLEVSPKEPVVCETHGKLSWLPSHIHPLCFSIEPYQMNVSSFSFMTPALFQGTGPEADDGELCCQSLCFLSTAWTLSLFLALTSWFWIQSRSALGFGYRCLHCVAPLSLSRVL